MGDTGFEFPPKRTRRGNKQEQKSVTLQPRSTINKQRNVYTAEPKYFNQIHQTKILMPCLIFLLFIKNNDKGRSCLIAANRLLIWEDRIGMCLQRPARKDPLAHIIPQRNRDVTLLRIFFFIYSPCIYVYKET